MLSEVSGKFHPQLRQMTKPFAPSTGNGFLKLLIAIGIALAFIVAAREPVFAEDETAPASSVFQAE